MKDTIKSIKLLVVGLINAIFLYPLIHEISHSIIAIIVGAKVVDINILPVPSVLCDIKQVESASIVFIGMSGMILPYILTTIIKPNCFWIWYINYVLKGISTLAFIISVVASVCFIMGNPLPNDDVTQILNVWENGKWICLIASILLAFYSILSMIRDKPVIRFIEFFNINDKKIASAA